MDDAETSSRTSVKEVPPVPIKTYRWEDLRRARRRGGYPWTYLYKQPYDGEVDPEQFKMAQILEKGGTDDFETKKELEENSPKSDEETSVKEAMETDESSKVESKDTSANVDENSPKSDEETSVKEAMETDESSKVESKDTSANVDEVVTATVSKDVIEVVEDKRAKSEEPRRKRKHSIESSHSRVSKYSLSPSGIMRRLKDVKEKVKPMFTFSKSDTKLDKQVEKDKEIKKESSSKVQARKIEGPLYIHIPLKPPPGETDEFSYLEFDGAKSDGEPKKEDVVAEVQTPETPVGNVRGVQMIILSAPSDDEILDEAPVAETPQESDSKFFDSMRMDELKNIAKDVADKYSPETKRKLASQRGVIIEEVEDEADKVKVAEEPVEDKPVKVSGAVLEEDKPVKVSEAVHEEDKSVKASEAVLEEDKSVKVSEAVLQEDKPAEEVKEVVKKKKKVVKKKLKSKEETVMESQKTDDDKIEEQKAKAEEDTKREEEVKMTVDEEDGLKTETVISQSVVEEPSESKKETKSILKKTVSFKRRSKDENDGIYEEVQVTSEAKDGEAPSDEGRNKWSKLQDHEYEPVNPPTEAIDIVETTTVETKKVTETAVESKPTTPMTPISDSDIEFLAAKAADFEMKTTASVFHENQGEAEEKPEGHGKKIQEAIKSQANKLTRQASILGEKATSQAEKIHTRVKSIKRPKIQMPPTPKFERPNLPKLKIEKPKMPKLSDKMKNIHMPTFTLPKKGTAKRSVQRRQFSTESNVGDSKKKLFDFSTYPRMFSRKKKHPDEDEIHTPRTGGTDVTPVSERTTLPNIFGKRWKKGKFTEARPEPHTAVTSLVSKESERSDAQGSVRIPLHSEGSMDKESLDLRTKEERELDAAAAQYLDDIDVDDAYMKENQEIHRASSYNAKLNDRWSHGTFHENLAVTEPEPIVTDLDNDVPERSSALKKKIEKIHAGSSGDIPRRGVLEEINQDEFFLRQKGISQDNIEVGAYLSSEIREAFRAPTNQDLRTSDVSLPEAPKRRPLKKPKRKKTPHVSQERISFDQDEPEEYPKYYNDVKEVPLRPKRRAKKERSAEPYIPKETSDLNILSDPKPYDEDYDQMYENEKMEGKEHPGIIVSDPYQEAFFRASMGDTPPAPPRRHRSVKSLNLSEHDSITAELNGYREIPEQQLENYRLEHEYQIPTPEEPPKRPTRTRSRTRSHSRSAAHTEEDLSRRTESFGSFEDEQLTRSVSDYVGYSVIDKSKSHEQPQAPRRRRSIKSERSEERFFTVPRKLNDEQPQRPTRNYSTLGPSRPPRKRSVPNLTDEEKENVHVSPYIEIDDEDHAKNLKSGEVIQKMKDRPLPAPPRPPRKSGRSSKEPLRDISQERNILTSADDFAKSDVESLHAEPLSEKLEDVDAIKSEKELKPRVVTEFEHEETITHGALVVQPFSGEDLQDCPTQMFSQSKEHIITVRRQVGDEETSSVPDEFRNLRSPIEQPQIIERIIERQVPVQLDSLAEVEVLKAHKLQVSDLDVDKLAVNELHASKIKVAEIDSSSINVSEINSNSGNLIVSGIELPASFFQQLVEKLQEQAEQMKPQQDIEKPAPSRPAATEEISSQTDKTEQVTRASQHEEPVHIEPSVAEERLGEYQSEVTDAFRIESPQKHQVLEIEDVEEPTSEDLLAEIHRIEEMIRNSQQEEMDLFETEDIAVEDTKASEEGLLVADVEMAIDKPLEDTKACEEGLLVADVQMEIEKPLEDTRASEEGLLIADVQSSEGLGSEQTPDDLHVETVALESAELPERSAILDVKAAEVLPKTSTSALDEESNRHKVEEAGSEGDEFGQKKTPFEERLEILESIETEIELVLDPPQRPPRSKGGTQVKEIVSDDPEEEEIEEIPTMKTIQATQSLPEEENVIILDFPQHIIEIPIDDDRDVPFVQFPVKRDDSEETPPPRPPHPSMDPDYTPSRPPASFFALRSPPAFKDFDIDDDIPMAPRRRRHHKVPVQSVSSSDEMPHASRRRHRTPEPSIPQLTGQLTRACVNAADKSLKRLIQHVTNKVLGNADGKQDVNVVVVILLVLIACLILLGWGDKQVHHHHWEYFNPPTDL